MGAHTPSNRASLASQPLQKKSEGSGDPYIHVWWPWNAIIQQFVYIPELPELCGHAIWGLGLAS